MSYISNSNTNQSYDPNGLFSVPAPAYSPSAGPPHEYNHITAKKSSSAPNVNNDVNMDMDITGIGSIVFPESRKQGHGQTAQKLAKKGRRHGAKKSLPPIGTTTDNALIDRPAWNEAFHMVVMTAKEKYAIKASGLITRESLPVADRLIKYTHLAGTCSYFTLRSLTHHHSPPLTTTLRGD